MGTPDPTKKTDKPVDQKQPIKKPAVNDLRSPDKTGDAVKGGRPMESM